MTTNGKYLVSGRQIEEAWKALDDALNGKVDGIEYAYGDSFPMEKLIEAVAPMLAQAGDARIPMPTSEDMAVAMDQIGYAWLKENAPHRLTQADDVVSERKCLLCAECTEYLKDGETPRQRIDRERRDSQSLIKLLAEARKGIIPDELKKAIRAIIEAVWNTDIRVSHSTHIDTLRRWQKDYTTPSHDDGKVARDEWIAPREPTEVMEWAFNNGLPLSARDNFLNRYRAMRDAHIKEQQS